MSNALARLRCGGPVKVTFNLPVNLHHRLKIAAASEGRTMSSIVDEAINRFVIPGSSAAFCTCCNIRWHQCSCPNVRRKGCVRCVNHCECSECSQSRQDFPPPQSQPGEVG
jgi:hypothetical protein